MAQRSEIFPETKEASRESLSPTYFRDAAEIAVVYTFIVIAIWTPPGRVNSFCSIVAAACSIAFAFAGRWHPRDLGLTTPLTGAGLMLLAGAALCGTLVMIGIPLNAFGNGYRVPLSRSWQYAIWALEQEFILQSIFFVRLEAIVGSVRAVVAAALLFALVHLPSPLLTVLSFCGALIFCAFFRRWRNLFPLGMIHAALGLTIAFSFPDKWLHHMRVGIGYLAIR